jgi:hypothetical protein
VKKYLKRIIILAPIWCFLLVWGFSLAKCEVLTLLYGKEFSDPMLYKENLMFTDDNYLKVLEYSENKARVFYISINKLGADVVTYTKENGQWKFHRWDPIWAKGGSASGVIWPYWWHFIYGGF